MSFVRTLSTLAVGFAAAKGVDKMKKMGGLDGMREAMRQSGNPGGVADQMGQMAEKMGVPGSAEVMRTMMGGLGNQAADMSEAAEAALQSLFTSMSGAAQMGTQTVTEMFESLAAGTAVGDAAEENAKLMIRSMIMAAKADGEIDAEERTKILDQLTDASDEEIAFVADQIDAPVDPMALAKDAGSSAATHVYSAALMAISVDTDAEKTFLKGLAQSLMIDEAKQAEIHISMGKPVL
ncbi:DUF533 domain-containing protein [Celeribacter litoreus]|uniref:DUF533 domain-containing protein n=1 Tax=Celeribacter litoreus TaxID=2876714 RepID=UPI001CCCE7CB|nr:DUF533 domain-containing protein [Celeribacter litoreus]MCA0042938.1 tellurite resistance TerB family protein [Celeribacter litoreus]